MRILTILLALAAHATLAQNSAVTGSVPLGIVEQPCPVPVPMPTQVRELLSNLFIEPRQLKQTDFASLTGDKAFAEYNAAARGNPGQDWPNLCRFHAANAALMASGKHPHIVFMGDSITENWLLDDSVLFNDQNVNRGIGGQTTPQILLRFRADVVALQPALVHLMAGTNDVAGNTGPSTVQDFRNNMMSMVELAKANGIGVLLASIPPAAAFSWQSGMKPAPRIRELNGWLRDYAAKNGLVYIDYYAVLSGPGGELRADLSNDGVHPNHKGYALMQALLAKQLAKMAKQ